MTRAKILLLSVSAAVLFAAPGLAAETVAVPHFSGVGLRGGGHVVIKYGATQKVTLLKGSTQFTRFKVEHGGGLTIDACDTDCPSHYDIEIEIVTPQIDAVSIEGGGAIDTQGAFPAVRSLAVAIDGGGDIDTRSVAAGDVKAAVNGGGAMKIAAKDSLMAAVSGGGEITYWGNPRVTQAISGGGEVERGE